MEVLETLGRGHITISFNETDQPVEWYESQFSGIWIGTFKNGRDDSNFAHRTRFRMISCSGWCI